MRMMQGGRRKEVGVRGGKVEDGKKIRRSRTVQEKKTSSAEGYPPDINLTVCCHKTPGR